MLERNTDLRLLDKQVELNAFDAENIRAGFWPNLSAFINYGLAGANGQAVQFGRRTERDGAPSGPALSVPIFDGFRRRNQVAQVRVQREQLALDRLNLANNFVPSSTTPARRCAKTAAWCRPSNKTCNWPAASST